MSERFNSYFFATGFPSGYKNHLNIDGLINIKQVMEGIKINENEQLDFLIDYLLKERGEKTDIPDDYHSKKGLLRSLMNVRPPLKISDEFIRIQDEFLT